MTMPMQNPYLSSGGTMPAQGMQNQNMQGMPMGQTNPYENLQGGASQMQQMPMQQGGQASTQNPLLMAQMLRNAERSGGGANNLRGLYDRVNAMMPGTAVNSEEMNASNPMNNQAQIQKLQEQGLI